MTQVIYFTRNADNREEVRILGNSSMVLASIRTLMVGEVKASSEFYCLHIEDGEDPCIIILRNLDDLQLAEGLAMFNHALSIKRMACEKNAT